MCPEKETIDGGVTAPLLSVDTVADYLRRRGVVTASRARTVELPGGVSSVVLRVDTAEESFVVKQARPRLAVAAIWRAKRERTLTEAAALRSLRNITPTRVPTVVDVDPSSLAMTMHAAPDDVADWKSMLLASPNAARGDVPEIVGETVGTWHRATFESARIRDQFQDDEVFGQLRLDPFHREVRRVHPDVAAAVDACLVDLENTRSCLVHGDILPKNVLVGPGLCWVIDAEVAHCGAPVFDVAFMTTHLMLKSVHAGHPAAFRSAADQFIAAYERSSPRQLQLLRLGWQIAVLLLARVDGKSPVDYLTSAEKEQVRRAALLLLRSGDASGADVWDALAQEAT